jgi:hypothetical protein
VYPFSIVSSDNIPAPWSISPLTYRTARHQTIISTQQVSCRSRDDLGLVVGHTFLAGQVMHTPILQSHGSSRPWSSATSRMFSSSDTSSSYAFPSKFSVTLCARTSTVPRTLVEGRRRASRVLRAATPRPARPLPRTQLRLAAGEANDRAVHRTVELILARRSLCHQKSLSHVVVGEKILRLYR